MQGVEPTDIAGRELGLHFSEPQISHGEMGASLGLLMTRNGDSGQAAQVKKCLLSGHSGVSWKSNDRIPNSPPEILRLNWKAISNGHSSGSHEGVTSLGESVQLPLFIQSFPGPPSQLIAALWPTVGAMTQILLLDLSALHPLHSESHSLVLTGPAQLFQLFLIGYRLLASL